MPFYVNIHSAATRWYDGLRTRSSAAYVFWALAIPASRYSFYRMVLIRKKANLNENGRAEKLFPSVNLTSTERSVLEYLIACASDAEPVSIRRVAEACYTSMTTVTRVAKKLGYGGFREMVYGLRITEGNGHHTIISSKELQASLTYSNDARDRFYDLLSTRQLIGIVGEGYSHLISEYMQHKLLGRGYPVVEQSYLDSDQFVHGLADKLSLVIAVSKSGMTKAIVQTARECRDHHVPLAAFVGNANSTVAELADMLFLIEDDQPLDSMNYEAGSFTGCCILAFERLLYKYQHMESA